MYFLHCRLEYDLENRENEFQLLTFIEAVGGSDMKSNLTSEHF